MFGWQLFINDFVRFALLIGVGLLLVYAVDLLAGNATLNLLSIAACVVGSIAAGALGAGLLAYCRWIERRVFGLLRWVMAAIPLVVMTAAIVWMFRQ